MRSTTRMQKRPAHKVLVCALLALLFFVSAQGIHAQAQPSGAAVSGAAFTPENRAAIEQKVEDYRHNVEERARQVLDREFLRGRSLLLVQASPDWAAFKKAANSDSSVNLSTLPGSVSNGKLEKLFIENLPLVSVKNYLSTLSIEVTVDKTIPEAQKQLIDGLLRGAVSLPERTRIKIQTANLATQSFSEEIAKAERERQASQSERQRLAEDKRGSDLALRQEQQKTLLLSREVDSLKGEIDKLKQTLGEQEKKVRDKDKKIDQLEEEMNIYKTPLGELKKLIKGLELPLTLLPIFVMLLGVILVLGFVFNASARKKATLMKESLELISQSMNKIGNNMQRSGESVISLAQTRKNEPHSASNAPPPAALPAAGEILAGEVATLKHDAELAWKECCNYRFLSLCELREWLTSGSEGQQKFLSLISALPPADAAQVINAFSAQDVRSLKSVVVDLSAKFMGYSLILTLHRAVLAAITVAPHHVTQLDAPQLIKASDANVAQCLSSHSPEEQAALLRILPASRWRRILELLVQHNPPEQLANTFAQLAQSQATDEKTFRTLLSAFELELAATTNNGDGSQHNVVLDDLVSQLDMFSPQLRHALNLALNQNPELTAELQSRTVTFKNVLMLDNSMLQELIEPFEAEQLAQLLLSLESNERNRLDKLIPSRTQSTVLADMKRLSATPASLKRNSSAGQRLQASIIERVKEMTAQGLLEIPKTEKRSA